MFSPVARAGASDYRADSFAHGGPGHVTNREDLPPAESVPSGVYVPNARVTARAEAQSQARAEGVPCSLQVVRIPQGPKGDCEDAIYVHVDDRIFSSASLANKQKNLTRKTRAAQHDPEGRVHATDFLQEQNPLRGDRRDTRVQAVEHGVQPSAVDLGPTSAIVV